MNNRAHVTALTIPGTEKLIQSIQGLTRRLFRGLDRGGHDSDSVSPYQSQSWD